MPTESSRIPAVSTLSVNERFLLDEQNRDIAAPVRRVLPSKRIKAALAQIDKVVAATIVIVLLLVVFEPSQAEKSVFFVLGSMEYILPFLTLAVLTAASVRATGLDQKVSKVFSGNEPIAIVLATAFGAFSPFCSCSAVPVVGALLAAGAPLAPVMAFWIASPLMDPEMFILTAAVFDIPFAIARTCAAVAMGLSAGFGTYLLTRKGLFANPLKSSSAAPQLSVTIAADVDQVVWRFWKQGDRRSLFWIQAKSFGWFLLRWLTLAFVIESLILAYIPQDTVALWLGSKEWWAVPVGVLAGVPAYLNGYAAIPMVAGLMENGMGEGAALAFMMAGGVTSSPATLMVYALVRHTVFAWYLFLGVSGSLLIGFIYQALL